MLEEKVDQHEGKVLQYYGDGCLVTFSSGIFALQCAKEIQETWNDQSNDVEVPLRIGIHIGDIVIKNESIYGDGVNLASRIESLGVPGAVLFSQRLVADLKNQPQFQYVSLGEFHFKNVDEPMEVFALSNKGFPIPKRSEMKGKLKSTKTNIEDKVSIAVLPFADMSPERDQEYFADGIAEEILNTLAQLKELKVVGRTSSFTFKGKNATIEKIGTTLKVNHILEGSVRKHGNKIRITAQLINVEDGFHIWSHKYDDDFTDIFKIQDTVAENIGKVLLEKLVPEQISKLVSNPNQNSEAYELFLRAKHILTRYLAAFNPEDFNKAETLFLASIEIDFNYALAHAGLADLYDTYLVWRVSRQNTKEFNKYDELRTKSSELAYNLSPTSVYVNQIKARVMLNRMVDLEEVYQRFIEAYEVNPNNPEVLLGLMNVYIRKGLVYDALKFVDKALVVDPLHTWAYAWKVYALGLLGDFELAIQTAKLALEINSEEVIILANLASIYSFSKDKEAALETYELVNQINPDYLNRDPYFQIKLKALKNPLNLPAIISLQPSIALLPVGNVEIDYLSGDFDRFEKSFLAWWERWKTGVYTSDLSFFSNKNCSIYLHIKNHLMYQSLRDKYWFKNILEKEKEKYDHNFKLFIRPEALFSK